jgi:hypothetical protein
VIKIIATNAFGDSEFSQEGAGGIIKLVPDAPINLVNDDQTTDDVVIRFTFEDSPSDGGEPILWYSVYYDKGLENGVYELLIY